MRKYGFGDSEIPLDEAGNLFLEVDPKEAWARKHPEFFPLDVNRAYKSELLRVPGFGPVTVNRILGLRRNGRKIRSVCELGKTCKGLRKAQEYVTFS